MKVDFMFILNSVLFGLGLAMDAFSVSLANGLSEPHMRHRKLFGIAATFAVFQGLMPLLGWVCVHTVVQWFSSLEKLIPWVSLVLLSVIGGKMLYGALSKECPDGECQLHRLTVPTLLLQGVATSIDALSVGFTIAAYAVWHAVLCSLIIAAVTLPVCTLGVHLGRRFGTRFSHKAEAFGGVLLILIGIEIFLTGIF